MNRRGALIGMHPYVAKMPALPYEAPRPGGPRSIRVTSCPDSCSQRRPRHPPFPRRPPLRAGASRPHSSIGLFVRAGDAGHRTGMGAGIGARQDQDPSICQALCEASPASASLGAPPWECLPGSAGFQPAGRSRGPPRPAGKTPALPAVRTTGLGGPRHGRSGPCGRRSGPFHAARETRPARVHTLAPPRLHLYWQGVETARAAGVDARGGPRAPLGASRAGPAATWRGGPRQMIDFTKRHGDHADAGHARGHGGGGGGRRRLRRRSHRQCP